MTITAASRTLMRLTLCILCLVCASACLVSTDEPQVHFAAIFYHPKPMHRNTFACSCTGSLSGLILAAVLVSTSVFAQTPQVPTFTAGKLDASAEGPTIDGRVNEAIWQSVQPYTTFTQQDPIEGAPASEKTEVRIIVGKGNVYVGIIAFDSDPSKIIVSQSRRDASLNETDSVVMVFDTFNDNQNAFVFGTNPLGIEYDGQVAREGQTSGVSLGGGTAGRHAARRHQRVQSELGRRLDGASRRSPSAAGKPRWRSR